MGEPLVIHAEEAATVSFDGDLEWASDGRFFDKETVTRELRTWFGQHLLSVWEIGRRLIWVKASMDHGGWEDWLETEFHLSGRTARYYMEAARFFNRHPGAQKSLAGAGLTKVLALAKADDDTVDNILNGRIETITSDDLEGMSVAEVKAKLKDLQTRLDRKAADQEALQKLLEDTDNARMKAEAALGQKVVKARDPVTVAEIRKEMEAFSAAMSLTAARILGWAERAEELSTPVAAELGAAMEYMDVFNRSLQTKFRMAAYGEGSQADLDMIEDMPREGRERYPIPDIQPVPVGQPKLSVVR